jgi:hypothetical protein
MIAVVTELVLGEEDSASAKENRMGIGARNLDGQI